MLKQPNEPYDARDDHSGADRGLKDDAEPKERRFLVSASSKDGDDAPPTIPIDGHDNGQRAQHKRQYD